MATSTVPFKRQCTKRVWQGFHAYQCKNRAQPDKTFCHAHDPDRREGRAAQRAAERRAHLKLDQKEHVRDTLNALLATHVDPSKAEPVWVDYDGRIVLTLQAGQALLKLLTKETP